MKKETFFFSLLMAIIMMVMCPQTIVADDATDDATLFEKYKVDCISEVVALKKATDSDESLSIIYTAEGEIGAVCYDSSKSLEQNMTEISTILAECKANLNNQRSTDLTSWKKEFTDYKKTVTAEISLYRQKGDPKTVIGYFNSAIDEVVDAAYDEEKTIYQNKDTLDNIASQAESNANTWRSNHQMPDFTTSPENKSTVTSLSKVVFTFTDHKYAQWTDDFHYNTVTDQITIIDANGNSVGTNVIPYNNIHNGYNQLEIRFDQIFADGTYTITLPYGGVKLAGDELYEYGDVLTPISTTIYVSGGTPSLEDVYTQPLTNDGMNSLGTVEYVFPGFKTVNWGSDISTNVATTKITIKNSNGDVVAKAIPEFGSSDNRLKITCDKEITDAGAYTITIPAGCIEVTTNNGKTASSKTDLVKTFNVTSLYKPDFTSSPADGETVTSIKDIIVTFGSDNDYVGFFKESSSDPNPTADITDYNGNILKEENGNTILGKLYDYIDDNSLAENQIKISLDDEITADGVYTISIIGESLEFNENKVLADCNITLTVGKGVVKFTTTPADGSVVTSISSINYSLEGANYVYACSNDKEITIKDESDNTVATARLNGDSYSNEFILTTPEAITAPGTYTITVPAGDFLLDEVATTTDAIITLTIPTPAPVKLNAAGYATYSSAQRVKVATDGVVACLATVDNNKITLNPINGDYRAIPAGTGVILYGDPNTVVEFEVTTDVQGDLENDLIATTKADGSVAQNTLGTVWALGDSNIFKKYTGDLKANRAYFEYESANGAKSMNIVFETPTGISEMKSETSNAACYNLNGQRVADNAKGIILKNGKKYFVAK